LHLAQGAAQRFQLTLISVALPLKDFKHLQDILHIVEGFSKRVHDLVNFLNRLLNSCRRCRVQRPGRRSGTGGSVSIVSPGPARIREPPPPVQPRLDHASSAFPPRHALPGGCVCPAGVVWASVAAHGRAGRDQTGAWPVAFW
jgi:hypothetical protein